MIDINHNKTKQIQSEKELKIYFLKRIKYFFYTMNIVKSG